jgi:alanine-synthesizing transaminase
MKAIKTADRMINVHSDIRGPLFIEAMEMQKRGINVLKLNTGNPATFGFGLPESIRNAIEGHENKGVGYCDFKGMPDARTAICEYHKTKGLVGVTPDDVFIGNGVSEVVSFALQAMLNNGDEVLVPTPCYSLWSNSVRLCGAKPVFYMCDEQSDWFPDCDDIISKITPKTRAIVLINPNNPTGALYSKELLLRIADIARKNKILIFSDEIYDRLVLDKNEFVSIAALAHDIPIITMNGLSKSHCLCGFRIGWMVMSGPREAFLEYRSNIVSLTSLRLCSNALAQLVVPAALDDIEYPTSMVRPGGRIYEQREATVSVLEKIDGISFVKNKAAFYLFPKIDVKKYNVTNDKIFARDLLHATDILMVPGSGFEWDAPDHFRIVMLPRTDELSSAMQRIGNFLDGYVQK